jgi:hypothetical protein
MPVDPDAVELEDFEVGEQGLLYFKIQGRTGSLLTLDLYGAGYGKQRRGQLRVTTSGADPFAIVGEFDDLDPGDTPEDFKAEVVVFDVNVGDEVVTTDGTHYVVQVVGDGENGLDNNQWSPTTNLATRFSYDDIAQNLGP